MSKKKLLLIISIIVIILLILLFILILNGLRNTANTNTINNNNNNIVQENSDQISTKVDKTDFLNNLKAYLKDEKSASVRLHRNKNGNEAEFNSVTSGLKAQDSDILISDNHISVAVAEDFTYEWDYTITDTDATFTISKDNPTKQEEIVLFGTVNNLNAIFVAYTELLGIKPKDALAFWKLATRDINKTTINDNEITISNPIFTTEESNKDNSYSFVLKIYNQNISQLNELIELEKNKESSTTLVE